MDCGKQLFIVDGRVLPATIKKVVEAKRLLDEGKAKNIQDAVNVLGLSRSAYYKYKDFVSLFYENSRGKTVTFSADLTDTPGTLGGVLNILAAEGVNILTINQTIPLNNAANVTITAETGGASGDIGDIFKKLERTEGVRSLSILARG